MRKNAVLFLLVPVLVFALFSCGKNNSSPSDGSANKTVEEILACFSDDSYSKQYYSSDMITPIRENLVLEGDILTVVHVTKLNAGQAWAYVYELSAEKDAIEMEENRRDFINSLEEDGSCVRYGNIVIFGTSPVIAAINQ